MTTYSPVQTSEPGMQQAGQIFADTAASFNGELSKVNEMMRTLQTSWTGVASTNFNSAMDSWEGAFNAVIKQLIHMLEVMGANASEYRAGEDEATNIANSFGAALPDAVSLPGV